ncbi:MAG: hypothetical protein WCP21_02045, partial [Armatimonadota bacterium]
MKPLGLTAGVAEAVISPPVGALLLGPESPATGIHDELYARALVLSDGVSSAAVVCLDLVGMDLALAADVEDEVRRQAGVDVVFLISTHTHSAPFTIPWSLLGREWLSAPEGIRWRGDLLAAVVGASCEAVSRLEPVRLRAGRAAAQAGLNRRLRTADGVVMSPNPDGVTVPWVDVLCADRADGTPLAVLFGHAAHPVVVHGASTLVSADYPGYAAAAVRRGLGGGVVALFAQGCGANVNGHPLRGGFEAAESVGEALAEAALQAVAEAEPVPPGPLRLASVAASLPLRPLPPPEACLRTLRECAERLTQAQAQGVAGAGLFSVRDDVLCARDLLSKVQRGVTETLPFGVKALALGDAWCLVAMTHEVFAEYQSWLAGISPWAHTMVAAYTNGCESYVPTDIALEEGGYEAASYPAAGAAWRYPYRVA